MVRAETKSSPVAALGLAVICFAVVLASRGEFSFEQPLKHAVPAGKLAMPLDDFNQALQRLQANTAQEAVRILWYGDFHTAAGVWPQQVRAQLQERFGAGGAGLVALGLRNYHHGMGTPINVGPWKTIPLSPAGSRRKRPGLLGLLGMGAVAQSSESSSTLELDSTQAWTQGRLSFELLFQLPNESSRFNVSVGAVSKPITVDRQSSTVRPSGLLSFIVESPGEPRIVVDEFVESPRLFGVIAEGRTPGIVLDSFGIDGARAATPISWNADSWVQQVRARNPSLVVVAYGTNDVGDSGELSAVGENIAQLISRVREASPFADCLLVGPTDRVDENWETLLRVAQLDALERRTAGTLGCAYFSAFEVMGKQGGLLAWSQRSPPLATRDRLRLTAAGYRRLGAELVKTLMASYADWRQRKVLLE